MYRLVTFAGIELPIYSTGGPALLPSGTVAAPVLATPDGRGFDPLGVRRAPLPLREVTWTRYFASGTVALVSQSLEALFGRVGVVGVLTRERIAGGEYQTIQARLLDVQPTLVGPTIIEVAATFRLLGEFWRGVDHDETHSNVMTRGALLLTLVEGGAEGAGGVWITNGGNAPAPLRVTFLPGVPVGGVHVRNVTTGTRHWVAWAGALAGGNTLDINAATSSVLKNGLPGYAGFMPQGGTTSPWMELAPGANLLEIGFGGSLDPSHGVRLRWRDTWV